jgi:hypothetical protein
MREWESPGDRQPYRSLAAVSAKPPYRADAKHGKARHRSLRPCVAGESS